VPAPGKKILERYEHSKKYIDESARNLLELLAYDGREYPSERATVGALMMARAFDDISAMRELQFAIANARSKAARRRR
jgi:hypothetical protein